MDKTDFPHRDPSANDLSDLDQQLRDAMAESLAHLEQENRDNIVDALSHARDATLLIGQEVNSLAEKVAAWSDMVINHCQSVDEAFTRAIKLTESSENLDDLWFQSNIDLLCEGLLVLHEATDDFSGMLHSENFHGLFYLEDTAIPYFLSWMPYHYQQSQMIKKYKQKE